MLNFYSSNYVQDKRPYNQININKRNNQINNNKERASSINIEKMKANAKIMPTTNSLNIKKIAISVNKQIQNKKKSPIKNPTNTENNFYISCNDVFSLKDTPYKANSKFKKNINNINKNFGMSKTKNTSTNYSNNKLRRKKILSVDTNIKKTKNVSHFTIKNNLQLISDIPFDNTTKKIENNLNSTNSINKTSNPTSNGAKTNNINNNINTHINKNNAILVNHQYKNRMNYNIQSPQKQFNSNIFNTCIGITSDTKGQNTKKNIGVNKSNNSKKVNMQIKKPLKLFEDNSSINLKTSGNFNVNFTNSHYDNDKKYIKANLKNSNTFYKINNSKNSNNNCDINNYKLLKDVLDIQSTMEKGMKENPTNSKSKKYNTIKHAFESLLKLLGNTIFKNNNNIINTFLAKLLIGYHEVVSAFSSENRKLKQVNYNLNEQYEKMSKDLFNSSKILKEKQKQIESLQKKINILENEKANEELILSQNNFNKNMYNITVNMNNMNNLPKIKTEQNEKILKLNEQNVEDLDALYFYDKIKMNKKKAVSIPKILIKQQEEEQDMEEEEECEEEDGRSKTVRPSDLYNGFIGLHDIKFKSPLIIKIRESFY